MFNIGFCKLVKLVKFDVAPPVPLPVFPVLFPASPAANPEFLSKSTIFKTFATFSNVLFVVLVFFILLLLKLLLLLTLFVLLGMLVTLSLISS